MNILILNWKDLKHPKAGGAEFVTESAARLWVKWGHEVTLFAAHVDGQPEREVVDGVQIIRRGNRFTVYWQAYQYWKHEGWQQHELVIDEINTIPFFTPLYVRRPAHWVPYLNQLAREIWFQQMPFPLSAIGYLLEPLYLKFYLSRPAITISESSRESLKQIGFPDARIWPMFVTTPLAKTLPTITAKELAAPTVLYLGSLRRMKGVDDVLVAFKEFRSTHSEAKLVVAGGGDVGDQHRLEVLAEELAITSATTFVGRVAEADKVKLYDAATFVTMASKREGWGLVITEANRRGRPGAAYNTWGTKDAILDEKTGHLANELSPIALANAWRAVVATPSHYAALSRAAHTDAAARTGEQAAEVLLKEACTIAGMPGQSHMASVIEDRTLPTVSVVIPTLNAARLLKECLAAIRAQDYPQDKVEIILADGGSTDGTQAVGKAFGASVHPNPLVTAESGKAVGVKAAKHELIALIDSDNILVEPSWLRRMVAPFRQATIMGSEPLYFYGRPTDGVITRYTANLGMGDPFVLFLGNYDRYSYLTNRWTGLQIPTKDRGDWLELTLQPPLIPTIGANGTMFRRSFLQPSLAKTKNPEYLFDIDLLAEVADRHPVKFAKVKVGVVHVFASSLKIFAKKQFRRVRDFLYYQKAGVRSYPWGKTNQWGRVKFVLACITVVPLLWQTVVGYVKRPDPAWLFHPLACYATLGTYLYGYLTFLRDPTIASRTGWRQT